MTESTAKKNMKISSEEEMIELGRSIGSRLFPGAFIAYFGGLGAGKTTLTKGIADSLGIHDILSPTFTIVRRHRGMLALDHFDAYRIEDPDELTAIGFDDYLSSGSVIVMEWSENVADLLPAERLEIHISGNGNDPRDVEIIAFGEKYRELSEGLSIC